MRLATMVATFVLISTGAAMAQGSAAYPPREYLQQGAAKDLQAFDVNKDGMISRQEFLAGQHRGDEMFKSLDTNGDGMVSRAEFSARGQAAKMNRFDRLDTNRDGNVSRDEVMAGRTAKFDTLDKNQDGNLSAMEVEQAQAMYHKGNKPQGDGRRGPVQ